MEQTNSSAKAALNSASYPAARENPSEYQQWLRSMHGGAHARRTAERNAAFLLPHLQPGMRLLDAGCGPGSITIGLADAIAPGGDATGVDMSAESLAAARAMATERGVTNLRFERADVHALPFDDATFDAAFMNAVLQHLANPVAALREVRRVMKPGGVIGVGDANLEYGHMIHPSSPRLERAMELTVRLRRAGGGTPDAGRRLRSFLIDAGFTRTRASTITDGDATDEAAAWMGEYQAKYLTAAPFVAHVVGLGLATEGNLAEMAAAWRAWGAAPGAMWVRLGCQAVGWAP